ncbi:tetratricopeptide repeat protein [Sphingobium aromaticiconvertens]|uniref:tetratricopeptide repeat protein n=1 Tax=Sphingobium aromaticiconvertens TaxID=365341 RepID=UPI003017CED6
MFAAPATASVDTLPALNAYARARLADSEGALGVAVKSYRTALELDPSSSEIARRSYFQGLESGDKALALRSAELLDAEAILPRDGTLLRLGDALVRKDWAVAHRLVTRMEGEGNFAFLGPILTSWISLGEGRYAVPVIDPKDRFATLARRYVDEHLAFQTLAQRNPQEAVPAVARALAAAADGAGLRLALAAQFAALGDRANALALLPDGQAIFAQARADIARGKGRKAGVLTPAEGFARLVARLASDISTQEDSAALGVRLARIASFADPGNAEIRVIVARLLTLASYPAFAVAEAQAVPPDNWHHAMAQDELVDALAAAGEQPQALALARSLAATPGADAQRQIRLGRLLSEEKDFAGAAAAFKAAQAGFAPDAIPWPLLLFEGSALEQGGRWEEARAVLERAAKIAPDEPVVLNYLGYAQVERRQNVEAALALLRKASALKPLDASISDSLGWAQFVAGDARGAVPVLEQAVIGAPDDATVNEHLGDALWSVGRRYEARYAWSAAATFAEGERAERLAAKTREGLKPEYAAP